MPAHLTPARMATIAALVVIALSVPIEIAGGVPGFPIVPPAIPIALGAAVVVGLVRWKWAAALGLFVGLFMLVGFTLARGYVRLAGAETPLGTVGVYVYVVGILGTLAGSGIALAQDLRSGGGHSAPTTN